jgi:hypothetical protein
MSGNIQGNETPYVSKYRVLVEAKRYADAIACAGAYRSMVLAVGNKDSATLAITYALESYAGRMSQNFSNALESLVLGKAEIDKITRGKTSFTYFERDEIQKAAAILSAEACLLYPKLPDAKDKVRLQTQVILALQPYCSTSRDLYYLAARAVYRAVGGEVLRANQFPSGQEIARSFECQFYGFETPEMPLKETGAAR